MSFSVRFPGHIPRRILIIGKQGSGKSWFARRLDKWLRAHFGVSAVMIDTDDHSMKRRGSGVTTIDTAIVVPRARARDRYDWIIDMDYRPAKVNGECDACGANGEVAASRIVAGNSFGRQLPCHGFDCILKHRCCDDERITPHDEIRMAIDERQSAAAAQLAALDKLTKPITAKHQDPGELLAGEMYYSIEGVAKGIDRLLAAVGSGLSFNDDARQQLRFDVTYHMSRLRGQFGGLKAIVHQSSGPAPF